jgi:hypothetical protein
VSFAQRFGSALNADVHFHCCVIDGVFVAGEDGQAQFTEASALTPEDCAAVQQQLRARVLRWFARAGHLDAADAREMASWEATGVTLITKWQSFCFAQSLDRWRGRRHSLAR